MTSDQLKRVGKMRSLARCGAARSLREEQGYSLREQAVLVGVSASTLSRWETGLARPRAASALRWAEALGVA